MALAPGAPRPGRAPTLPGNVQATSTQLFCHVCSAGASLGLSVLCLAPVGKHRGRPPGAWTWGPSLFFLPEEP